MTPRLGRAAAPAPAALLFAPAASAEGVSVNVHHGKVEPVEVDPDHVEQHPDVKGTVKVE